MPMIIKNNVRYCSTGGDAENIVYDNAESGMEATNMQDAIDELNSNLVGVSFITDENGKITGYTTATGGADSVFPFSSSAGATATAADITAGKTAWVNGELITGIRPVPVNSQSGTISTGVLWRGDTFTYNITFEYEFDTIPEITYTVSLSSGLSSGYTPITISNVTREGFVCKLYSNPPSNYGNAGYGTIYWTATV